MSLFTAPTVAEVLAEVKLSPPQVNKTFSQPDYENDVAGRIPSEQAFTELTLTSVYSVSAAALDAEEFALGKRAILYRVAASVYHTAGQLNEAYKAEALDYERRAKELMDLIAAGVGSRTEANSGTTTFSRVPTRVDGYSGSETEYASSRRCGRYC